MAKEIWKIKGDKTSEECGYRYLSEISGWKCSHLENYCPSSCDKEFCPIRTDGTPGRYWLGPM